MKIQLLDALKVSVLAIILSFGLSYALAWTAPTATPPAGNVFAPINTGADLQTKTGNLSVANLGTNSITVTGTATVNDVYITSIGKWASELYPVYLIGSIHTTSQCSSAGGVTIDITGGKLCKLSSASCPVGWTKYQNWSTTSNTNLGYIGTPLTNRRCRAYTCSSGYHAWSNTATETKWCTGGSYDGGLGTCEGTTVNPVATITEIGCY